MEPVIAQRFEEITDKKVRRRGTLRDNDYPYMLANIDRWIVGENAGLEIKTADWRMSKQWGDKDDPQDMTVPDSYYCQCMHYMAVTGADYWYIGALIGGNDFRVKEIMRNEDDIKYIREQEKEFWNHVTEQTMPAVDGSDSTVHTLVGLYNTPNGKEIDLPEEACGLIAGEKSDTERVIKKVYYLTNIDHTNEHFSLDPKEQLAAIKDMRKNGLEPLGNWHSHPETPARPSKEDIRLAFDSEASYLIMSLMDQKNPVIHAFRVREGQVSKDEIVTI